MSRDKRIIVLEMDAVLDFQGKSIDCQAKPNRAAGLGR
jgi:hypothetical protein